MKFPNPKGLVAAPAHAWGLDFDITIGGDAALFEMCGTSAVVDVTGPLVQHTHWLFANYEGLRLKAAAAFASEAKEVVLRINSPGGDFAGSLELSKDLRAMARASGKRLVAFTDSEALSAGYALACAADSIVITESAYVGSVGVWAALCDETERDKAQGLNIAVIASGERKADRNPHVAMTAGAVESLQVQVDAMASLFFDVVSAQREMSVEAVKSLQGGMHFGSQARALGLADRVVNGWSEFIEGDKAMGAKSTKDARAAYRESLAKLAAGEDDDAKEARSALSAMDDEDDKKAKKAAKAAEKDGEDGKEDGKAKGGAGDGDKDDPNAAAKAEDEKKKEDEAKARAAASGSGLRLVSSEAPSSLDILARLHALEAERAQEKEDGARAKALAGRPDFSEAVRASLASRATPLAFVENACKTWPRVASGVEAAASAQVPGGTRGEHQATPALRRSEADDIDRAMGVGQASVGGVKNAGTTQTFEFMSPADVTAAAAKLGLKEVS